MVVSGIFLRVHYLRPSWWLQDPTQWPTSVPSGWRATIHAGTPVVPADSGPGPVPIKARMDGETFTPYPHPPGRGGHIGVDEQAHIIDGGRATRILNLGGITLLFTFRNMGAPEWRFIRPAPPPCRRCWIRSGSVRCGANPAHTVGWKIVSRVGPMRGGDRDRRRLNAGMPQPGAAFQRLR